MSTFLLCQSHSFMITDQGKFFLFCLVPAGSGVNVTHCGDITPRRELRDKLECQSFLWYLENIYPELQLPGNGDIAFG